MNRTARAMLRKAAPVALAMAALLAVPSPAQAHPTVSGPHCDAGAGEITCLIGISGQQPPVDIRWYFNGVHFGEYDNLDWASASCPIGSRVSVAAVVTDASGVPVRKAISKRCPRDIP